MSHNALKDFGHTYSINMKLIALNGIVYQMFENGVDDINYSALSYILKFNI